MILSRDWPVKSEIRTLVRNDDGRATMGAEEPTNGRALVYIAESVRNIKTAISCFILATVAAAKIHQNPGSDTPPEVYPRRQRGPDSPIQQTYIKGKDGLYIAAAIRQPKGDGRYPETIIVHGAPGGRGMEQSGGWSRGDHGRPVCERFLQEGYVVVIADYRGGNMNLTSARSSVGMMTSIDDGLSVIDYVPYVDPSRLNLYGVNLGGTLVMNLVSRVR